MSTPTETWTIEGITAQDQRPELQLMTGEAFIVGKNAVKKGAD
jgi:hypothetical protein